MTINKAIKDMFPEIAGNAPVATLFDTKKDILGIKVTYGKPNGPNGENSFIVSRYGYANNYSVSVDKFITEKADGTSTLEEEVNEKFLAFEIADKERGFINRFIVSGFMPVWKYLTGDYYVKDDVEIKFLRKGDCTPEELYAIYAEGGNIEAFRDTDDFQKFYGLKNNETEGEGPRFLDNDKMSVKIGHLHEELDELEKAWKEGDLAEAADAIVDLIYVASGAANLCNLPIDVLWRDVQNSNMIGKERVKKLSDATKRGSTFDVKKTKDWVGPRGSELIEVFRRWL